MGDIHPLDGRIFKMKNVYDGGSGPTDQWVGFRESDLAWRANHAEEDQAVPIRFYMVADKPHTYKLK